MPQNWFNHNNNIEREYKNVYEGNFSAKMESREKGSTARVYQVIPINPGSKIRIRFKFYIEQWKVKGARTYCYFRTESAEKYTIPTDYLKDFYNEENYRILRGGGYGLTYFPHELNIWQQFDETIEVPLPLNILNSASTAIMEQLFILMIVILLKYLKAQSKIRKCKDL